jgi:hypothetical protein
MTRHKAQSVVFDHNHRPSDSVAYGIANKVDGQHGQENPSTGENGKPPSLADKFHPRVEHRTPLGGRRLGAEAKEVERSTG